MQFFTKKVQGSISLFLVLIMLPMFVLAGLIVDGARISAARTAVSGAGDLAMNAALSEYDKVLHDVYGLFAMSTSMEELQTNVNMYFSNTINNTGLLQSSDSYTRSFFNSIGSMFSGDDISFDNIVDTEVESFSMLTVDNSALANPSVLRRQIVDYMKIRGPVNIGTSLLSKLGCIGETSKQNKVIKAKVTYDKKLKSVQDACQTAYEAINAFNDNVTNSKYNNSTYLDDLNTALAASKENTKQMVRRIVASKMDRFKVKSLGTNSDYNKSVKEAYDGVEGEGEELAMARYNTMVGLMSGLGVSTTAITNGWKAAGSNGGRIDGYTFSTDFEGMMSRIESMNNEDNYNTDSKIYTLGRTSGSYLKTAYGGLSDEQKSDELVGKYGVLSGVADNAKSARDHADKARTETWPNEATTYGRDSVRALYNDWYSKVETIVDNLDDAIEALETVKKKADELKTAKTDWRGKLDDLSESDIKTSLEGDYSNCAQQIDVRVVDELITILTNNKNHFKTIKDKIGNIDIDGKKLVVSNFESYNYYGQFKIKISVEADTTAAVDTITDNEMASKYHGVNDIRTGLSPSSYSKITESIQFYKFLTNNCGSGATDETSKSAAKTQRNTLVNNANAAGSAAAAPSTEGMTTGNYVGDTGLSSEISAAIDLLAAAGVTGNTFSATTISGDKDDDMADKASKNLADISSLLDGLANIAESATKTIYLEEYFTEMFSCYTTGKGDHPKTVSLSNVSLVPNKFYRSEAEYILWGNASVEANIAATVALIFGIRFALNSIFAFTNSNTRTPALAAATAIAGWTGFGVPIVQSVILLAWALAESIIDVNFLCDGEDVVIYKTWASWYTGPEGVKDVVERTVEACIENVFDEIEQAAMDAIDSLQGKIEDYASQTIEGVAESIKSSVSNSIQTLVISVVGESNYNLQQSDIEARVNQMIDSFENSINGSDATAAAMRAAVTVLRGQSGAIASKLYDYYKKAIDGTMATVDEVVEDLIKPLQSGLNTQIHNALDSVATELKNEASRIISEGGDQVKEKLNGAIDDFLGGLGGSGGAAGAANGTSPSSAVRLTLNYKEYLKIFILLNMIGNENKMLNRCAKLIQINVSEKNPSFNISKAYTMAQINSTVTIRTTFFDIPISTGVDASGNPTYDLDFNNLGTGRQRINYIGILGY